MLNGVEVRHYDGATCRNEFHQLALNLIELWIMSFQSFSYFVIAHAQSGRCIRYPRPNKNANVPGTRLATDKGNIHKLLNHQCRLTVKPNA